MRDFMGSFVCDHCGAEFKMDDFGLVDNKCKNCGGELRYTEPETKNITQNRGIGIILVVGFIILLVTVLDSFLLGILFLIIAIVCLIVGRYIDNHYESVTTDKLRRISIGIFFLCLFLFILFIWIFRMPLIVLDILLFLQISSISLFAGSSFKELSKTDTARISDKLDLKIAELRKENVKGLEEVLNDLDNIKSSDIYLKLIDSDLDLHLEDRARNRMIDLADQIMREDKLDSAFPSLKGHIIGFIDFCNLYLFLENIYTIYKGGNLLKDDYNNIYFSGLDEQIALGMEKFNGINKVPESTLEFFEKIFNMKWDNDKSKKFLEKFEGLRNYYMINYYDDHYNFVIEENRLIKFLTVCSAYSRNKTTAGKEDVLTAHKTYFKLINTDLTIYKSKTELLELGRELAENQSEGYLVCDKCGNYYKLQSGESPEEFTDDCKCGGKLEFRKCLDELSTSEHVSSVIGDSPDDSDEMPEEDRKLKMLPRDITFAVFITLLAIAVQTVIFVLQELFKLKLTGLVYIMYVLLFIVLLFCLTLGAQRLFVFLGWDLLSSATKKNEDDEKRYLVCLRCESYYEIQPGESFESFPDTCECGGKMIPSVSKNLKGERAINIHPSFILLFIMTILSFAVLYFTFKAFNIDMDALSHGQSRYFLNFLLIFLSQVLTITLFRVGRIILEPLDIKLNFE